MPPTPLNETLPHPSIFRYNSLNPATSLYMLVHPLNTVTPLNIYAPTNLSINRITSAPSRPLSGLGPSSKK